MRSRGGFVRGVGGVVSGWSKSGVEGVVSVAATFKTSLRESWIFKDSKGTRRRDEEAVQTYHPV